MEPAPAPDPGRPFRRGLLTALLLGLGPQLVTGLGLQAFHPPVKGQYGGVEQAMVMMLVDLGAFAASLIGGIVGIVVTDRGRRGAFAGGWALGLGAALLLTYPLCMGTATVWR